MTHTPPHARHSNTFNAIHITVYLLALWPTTRPAHSLRVHIHLPHWCSKAASRWPLCAVCTSPPVSILPPLPPHAGDAKARSGSIAELFEYDNFTRVAADVVEAGDICAVTGLSDCAIGETICDKNKPEPLPTITVRC